MRLSGGNMSWSLLEPRKNKRVKEKPLRWIKFMDTYHGDAKVGDICNTTIDKNGNEVGYYLADIDNGERIWRRVMKPSTSSTSADLPMGDKSLDTKIENKVAKTFLMLNDMLDVCEQHFDCHYSGVLESIIKEPSLFLHSKNDIPYMVTLAAYLKKFILEGGYYCSEYPGWYCIEDKDEYGDDGFPQFYLEKSDELLLYEEMIAQILSEIKEQLFK